MLFEIAARLLRGARGGPAVIGHRGAMGHAPENTLTSFRRGLELGADLIELDVQRTRDGRLVVIHDPSVNRTSNGSGLVCDLSFEEIERLDAGSWFGAEFAGEKMLAIEDALGWARGRVPLAIELKVHPIPYPGIEQELVAALRQHDLVGATLVISFDHQAIRRIKEVAPDLPTGVLYASRPADPVELARHLQVEVLLPHWSLVDRALVEEAHRAGFFVATWVVNEREPFDKVVACGVDAIGSDYPDRVVGWLGR